MRRKNVIVNKTSAKDSLVRIGQTVSDTRLNAAMASELMVHVSSSLGTCGTGRVLTVNRHRRAISALLLPALLASQRESGMLKIA